MSTGLNNVITMNTDNLASTIMSEKKTLNPFCGAINNFDTFASLSKEDLLFSKQFTHSINIDNVKSDLWNNSEDIKNKNQEKEQVSSQCVRKDEPFNLANKYSAPRESDIQSSCHSQINRVTYHIKDGNEIYKNDEKTEHFSILSNQAYLPGHSNVNGSHTSTDV